MTQEILPPKDQEPQDRIAQGLHHWLVTEAHTSSDPRNRNNYLDDLDDMRARLALPQTDPDNTSAQKMNNHHTRLPLFFELFSEDPTNDTQSARVLFCFLMRAAGAYKMQSYFQADKQEDFVTRKANPPYNVITAETTERLTAFNQSSHPYGIEPLNRSMLVAIDEERQRLPLIIERAQSGEDFGKATSLGAAYAQRNFQTWIGLSVHAIAYAASLRNGNLALVPFFEPKSITDQKRLLYPLAKNL